MLDGKYEEFTMKAKLSAANQKAYDNGQDDWRARSASNPYPVETTDHEFWLQGWEAVEAKAPKKWRIYEPY